jgi:hypothetical protein
MQEIRRFKDINFYQSTEEVLKQVKYLYEHTDIETRQKRAETIGYADIFTKCIEDDHFDVIKYVVNKKNVNINYDQGLPLSTAINKRRFDIALFLLNNGAKSYISSNGYLYNTIRKFEIKSEYWFGVIVHLLRNEQCRRWIQRYFRMECWYTDDLCSRRVFFHHNNGTYYDLNKILNNHYNITFRELWKILKLIQNCKYDQLYIELFYSK